MWNEGYFVDETYTYGYYRDVSPFYQRYCLLTHGYDVRIPDENACHCELGYGQGMSINIHAAAVPGHWVGTDFNPAHASHANLLCEAAQTGAQLWECSFAEMLEKKDMPLFDSISLHGIWSWISRENQEHVVEFIRRYLKPGGIVYNSYNCFPGWAANHPVRELFLLQDKYIRADYGSADRRHIGKRSNPVRNHPVAAAMQPLHAVNQQRAGAGCFNLCTARVEKRNEIFNLRLSCRIVQHGIAPGGGGGKQHVFRGADARKAQRDPGTAKSARRFTR